MSRSLRIVSVAAALAATLCLAPAALARQVGAGTAPGALAGAGGGFAPGGMGIGGEPAPLPAPARPLADPAPPVQIAPALTPFAAPPVQPGANGVPAVTGGPYRPVPVVPVAPAAPPAQPAPAAPR